MVGALLLAWLGRQKDPGGSQFIRLAGVAFSTIYEVKITAPSFAEDAASTLQTRINQEVEFVDAAMSRFRDDSEISRFNDLKTTEPFGVSKETAVLLDKARQVSALTKGAFDITVGPLVRLWGFYYSEKGRDSEPTHAEIAEAKATVGYEALEIDLLGARIRKTTPDLHVDLSAVAKGYAVDRIAEVVEDCGYANFMVEIGGEVRAKGVNQTGRAWRIGIEKPIYERMEVFQVIALENKAVATSGDYRNYYELKNKRISHTIDPRTGRPVDHTLASVSVVHDECAMADALATGLTVLGPKGGYTLAKARGIPALFIERLPDGSFADRVTPEFERLCVSRADKKQAQE